METMINYGKNYNLLIRNKQIFNDFVVFFVIDESFFPRTREKCNFKSYLLTHLNAVIKLYYIYAVIIYLLKTVNSTRSVMNRCIFYIKFAFISVEYVI